MIAGYSIRKSAETVGGCVKTAFYMRHKLLDSIRVYIGRGTVEGIVELDETFVAESFKGNHKKSGFVMPRPSRHRGSEVKKRGISSEQVCIATGIDRNGNIIHLYFFKVLQYLKEEKETSKNKNWLIYGTSSFVDTRISQYRYRKTMFS